MKTYKVIFDGYIDVVDLEKLIGNEFGRSAAVVKTSENRFGTTEAMIEFDDSIPYEVIELMTDGNIIVEQLILEDVEKKVIKESMADQTDDMLDTVSDFMRLGNKGQIFSVLIQSYAETYNLTFEDSQAELSDNIRKLDRGAFDLYIVRR